ncbi:predicted protein [Nematostella vectensis]|uniref:Fibronectin type-III domain-containing protein n=1 Tax=Nematostella vectensis TaxID=45351 RepID=A7SI12_NEMVE|nr:predicted protein [Nematostella vectensis]|eukprot:XP_001628731.1 predicted protein [Nematostella vectensis]
MAGWLRFLLLLSTIAFQSAGYAIYRAKCKSRCYLQQQRSDKNFLLSCLKPCEDKNFEKIKKCPAYCRQLEANKDWLVNTACRGSCKFLKALFNNGKPSISNPANLQPPTVVKAFYTRTKNMRSLTVSWNISAPESKDGWVYVVQQRTARQHELPQQMGKWVPLTQTRSQQLKIPDPGSALWCQFRVAVVQQDSSSNFTTSTLTFIPPERPGPVRDFRVTGKHILKNKAQISIAWRKPENSDLPVSKYRVYWSKRLDTYSTDWQHLREHRGRVPATRHKAIIHGLELNTTYHIAIQAISRYQGKRLKGPTMELYTRTLVFLILKLAPLSKSLMIRSVLIVV